MKLSVIISNRNDLTMLAITVRSVLEGLVEVPESEIVISDNSDRDRYEQLLKFIPPGYVKEGKVRIFRQDFPCLFTAREQAAREAKGDYLFCLDSHMLVGNGTLRDLVAFMDRADEKVGFAHAPINWCHQHESIARHDRDMETCELGDWGTAHSEERKITWKGMPWICRRNWFFEELGAYGALSQHRLAWGGGDMHIGVKPWLLGFENWAVPTRPCIHIGPFPGTDKEFPYRLYSQSGRFQACLGFLVSCYVLGGEGMMERNREVLEKRFGKYFSPRASWKKAMRLGEDEREWILRKQKMSFEELLEKRPWNG